MDQGFVEIGAEEVMRRGYGAVSIRVDAASAGMFPRLFPAKDTLLALSGPPGGPLVLVIWDCTSVGSDIEQAIRSRLVPPWTNALEIGKHDRGWMLGAQRDGMTFASGVGLARIAWFGVLVEIRERRILVAAGVPGSAPDEVDAAEVLSNASIQKAIASLEIV